MSYDLLVARREHLRLIGRTNGEEAVAGARRFRVPRHRLPKAVSESRTIIKRTIAAKSSVPEATPSVPPELACMSLKTR